MIVMDDYLKGRDKKYPQDFTMDIIIHAATLLEKVNDMLSDFGEDRGCNSGWRPKTVQMEVNPRAPNSKHITGDAIDIEDSNGKLKCWLKDNPDKLEKFDLYQEAPESTPTWVHVQQIPPTSKKRVFKP